MIEQELIQQIEWRDLRKLSFAEMLIENNITIPWLVVSLTLAYFENYFLALPFSAFFFLAALRQVHNGFHNSLGTNRFLTSLSLYLNSILLMSSIHAVKFNHLRHHKYCLTDQDYEGKSAKMKWYQAILYGPVHIFLLHKTAFQLGNSRTRRKIKLEMFSVSVFVLIAVYLRANFLIYHIIAMVIGEFLTAFFAVWTVHHDTEETPHLARTQRTFWKNKLTLNMFYHLEHHLFPAVPTIKLPELAKRIDDAIPELNKKQTF